MVCEAPGAVEKVFLECESLLSRFLEIQMSLHHDQWIFQENRTSKLVHSRRVLDQATEPRRFSAGESEDSSLQTPAQKRQPQPVRAGVDRNLMNVVKRD